MSFALSRSSLATLNRVAASLLGGWVFVWGAVTLGIALAMTAGMPFDQARTLMYLLAFLIFLVAFLWAFATSSVRTVWLVLAGSGALMTGLAWLLIPTLA
jgi:hypothetical protein